jgi:hypothetical protein
VSNRIDITLRPALAVGLIAASPWLVLAAASAILASDGPGLLWLFLPTAALGALCQVRTSGLLRSPGSVTRLTVEDDRLTAHFADGRCFTARPASESRVFGQLAILKLQFEKLSGRRPSLVVLFNSGKMGSSSGNVQLDDFRRLRVWLKLGST